MHGSGQAEGIAVTRNRALMTVADQIKKGAYLDSLTLLRYGDFMGSCPGLGFGGQPEPFGLHTTGAKKQ